jgi:hypothetical protein
MIERLPDPPILTPPSGWLGFLGIKSGGKQPERVEASLKTNLEMLDFYLAGSRTVLVNNALAAVANGLTLMATVPVGKVWIVEGISALSAALGAVAPQFGMFIAANNGIAFWQGPPSGVANGITGQVLGIRADRRLILNPGNTLSIFTSAAGAMTAFNWGFSIQGVEVSA